ncbi:MAG TPA: hypothetical protein VMJ10_08805 [Kofleriaceae bacterium]|nr:hypothetical protein [Kofleriaceae bacterium]
MRWLLLFALGCQDYVISPPSPPAPPPSWHVGSIGVDVDLEGVWMASADDVFAVGKAGTIVRTRDGVTWSRLASPATVDLHAICGTGRDDIYAIGDRVSHYPDPPGSTVYVLHSRDDGATWQPLPVADDLWTANALWCGAGTTILAGTYGDKSRAGFGTPTTMVTRPSIDGPLEIRDQRMKLPAHTPCRLCDSGAVLVTRDRGATWTGGMTMQMQYPRGVWAIGDDVWVTGLANEQFLFGYLVHSGDGGATFDGVRRPSTTRSVTDYIRGSFNAIWAGDADHVYVVGDTGLVYQGGEEHATGLGPLAAVWGTGDEIFVAGKQGTLARITDTRIERIAIGTDRDLTAISGLDDAHVYVVGAHGVVVRFE